MCRYIGKRLMTGVFALLFLTAVTFFLVHLMPGNPFETGNVSGEILAALEAEYGLDQPLHIQYIRYMSSFFQGDLGMSMKKQGVSVNEILMQCIPVSMRLGGAAFLLAAAGGILMGIAQIMTGKRWLRKLLTWIQGIGLGVPNFVLGLLLMLYFGTVLKWLPVSGIKSAAHYILPAVSLAVSPACTISRLISSAGEKEKKKSYVRFLRAQGIPEGKILTAHMARPIFSQILVCLGQILAALLTGSFVVENIFTIPGLGREFVNSISNRDYTAVMGLTVFMGTVLIVIQILLDILQIFLEPKLRAGFRQRR